MDGSSKCFLQDANIKNAFVFLIFRVFFPHLLRSVYYNFSQNEEKFLYLFADFIY